MEYPQLETSKQKRTAYPTVSFGAQTPVVPFPCLPSFKKPESLPVWNKKWVEGKTPEVAEAIRIRFEIETKIKTTLIEVFDNDDIAATS